MQTSEARRSIGGTGGISRAVSVSVIGTFLILLVGALYYAREFFLPVLLAILLTFVLEPLVRALTRRRLPTAAAVVIVAGLLGGGVLAATAFLSAPLTQMVSTAPEVAKKLRERFSFIEKPLATVRTAGEEIQKIGGSNSDGPQAVVVGQPGLLPAAAGTLAEIGTTLGATLILLVFLLASGNTLRTKLIHSLPSLSDKKRSLRVLTEIEGEVSRYLLTITAINAGVGLCVGIAMAVLGMPNPVLWGVAAALLNFIPFVGSLVGEALAFAVAMITFPTLAQAALPPIAYLLIAILEGSVITPTILGRRLELSPVSILIFLALTTWMWGLVGTVIGVPVLVVVRVFSGHFASLGWLAELLSGGPPATTGDTQAPVPTSALRANEIPPAYSRGNPASVGPSEVLRVDRSHEDEFATHSPPILHTGR